MFVLYKYCVCANWQNERHSINCNFLITLLTLTKLLQTIWIEDEDRWPSSGTVSKDWQRPI